MDTISIYATHKIDVYRHFTDILYLYYTEKKSPAHIMADDLRRTQSSFLSHKRTNSLASCWTSSPAEKPYLKWHSLSSPWAMEDWV